jgi:hypothetical protein
MNTMQSLSPRRKRAMLNIFALCALVVVLMVAYGWSAGELGLSENPHALLKDENLGFINALIGGFALAGAIFALYMNQTQLEATLTEFRESNYLTHYAELDRIYFDLMKLAVEHPHLRRPETIADPTQRRQYDAYAYMVWNFIETVIDRIEMENAIARLRDPEPTAAPRSTPNGSGNDGCGLDLEQTWRAAIGVETRIHGAWWTQANADLFKPGFAERVETYAPGLQLVQDEAGPR